MTWRFMRQLLLVLGAYFLASSAHHWIESLQRMTYEPGDNASLGVYAIDEVPRALAVIGAVLLPSYTLGPAIARRWVWVLAGVFTLFRVIDVVGWRKAPSTRGPVVLALAVGFSTFTLLRSSSTIAVMLQSSNLVIVADTQFQEGKYEEAKQTLL